MTTFDMNFNRIAIRVATQSLSMEDAVARQLSLKEAHPDTFAQNLYLFEDMMSGGDGDGARGYYPGWTDEMFTELLSKIR